MLLGLLCGLDCFSLPGFGQGFRLPGSFSGGLFLLPQSFQLTGFQWCLPLGTIPAGVGVLQGTAHGTRLPFPQSMGQLEGGVLPEEGFLAFHPLG